MSDYRSKVSGTAKSGKYEPAKVKMTTKEFMIMTNGKNPYLCPACGQTEMEIIQVLPPIRGSPVNIYIRPIPK